MPPAFSLDEYGDCDQQMPVFYTDGSCPFPKLPGGGLCSWSIVWDSLDNDCERRQVASLVKDQDIIPESLIPIQASLAFGPQSVNRAELTAIIQVIRSVVCGRIFSDSAWAIGAFERVRDNPFPEAHIHEANSDLLLWLCELAETRDLFAFDVQKIKSHLSNQQAEDDLHLYHVLGKYHAKFLDPLLVEEAALLPITTWDVVRILDMAVAFCKKYLKQDLFPAELYAKKWYLGCFGYRKYIAGYTKRPVLSHALQHYEAMQGLVSGDSLALPMPYPIQHEGTRCTDPLDSTPHEQRVLQLKKLDHRIRKVGYI
eukprot:s619_g19.t1